MQGILLKLTFLKFWVNTFRIMCSTKGVDIFCFHYQVVGEFDLCSNVKHGGIIFIFKDHNFALMVSNR